MLTPPVGRGSKYRLSRGRKIALLGRWL